MLIGHVSRDIDVNVLRENWEKNYPVRHVDGLPDFVEVTAGMKHEIYSELKNHFVCCFLR
jgi:hypothetical protein